MPWKGRRDRETERPPHPELKRPSNPRMVAKAAAPAVRPSAAAKGATSRSKRASRARSRAALPASVTMAVERAVRAELLPEELAIPGEACGVLWRFVVQDANGAPIAPAAYKIRKHLLPMKSEGFVRSDEGARIAEIRLDESSSALDFTSAGAVLQASEKAASSAPRPAAKGARSSAKSDAQGREELFEYFSFEMEGVSYAIPRSGYVLVKTRRGRVVTLERTPQAGGSIHGAVVAGLVSEGGSDAYSFEVA